MHVQPASSPATNTCMVDNSCAASYIYRTWSSLVKVLSKSCQSLVKALSKFPSSSTSRAVSVGDKKKTPWQAQALTYRPSASSTPIATVQMSPNGSTGVPIINIANNRKFACTSAELHGHLGARHHSTVTQTFPGYSFVFARAGWR